MGVPPALRLGARVVGGGGNQTSTAAVSGSPARLGASPARPAQLGASPARLGRVHDHGFHTTHSED